MTIRALIFDCDGVLVDSEVIAIQAERELLANWGLEYDYETFVSRFVGLHNRDLHAALAADALARGVSLPQNFGPLLHENNWKRYETELTAIKGVTDVVESFAGPLAVASSSGPEKLIGKLQLAGLYALFVPHIYSSDLVMNGKPAPDLFLFTARKLGVRPEQCLVIEDSINGVKAARAAGMTAWGFTGGAHADPGLPERLIQAGAHAIFSSHLEVARALQEC